MMGCQNQEKNGYTKTYTLEYYYLEGCLNCEHFTEKGIPLIKEEFGDHMLIIKYNMDDQDEFDQVKAAYDKQINNIIDFNQDDYGKAPFLVLNGYYGQLGIEDVDKYLDNLIAAIKGEKLRKPGKYETYYYFSDSRGI